MLFTFENGVMNSFNKTEAAVFSCRLCFPRAFPFISLTNEDRTVVFASRTYVFGGMVYYL